MIDGKAILGRIYINISGRYSILLTNILKCGRGHDGTILEVASRQTQRTVNQSCGSDTVPGWLNLRWSLSYSCRSELAHPTEILGGGI